jgi:hypothetical protein
LPFSPIFHEIDILSTNTGINRVSQTGSLLLWLEQNYTICIRQRGKNLIFNLKGIILITEIKTKRRKIENG